MLGVLISGILMGAGSTTGSLAAQQLFDWFKAHPEEAKAVYKPLVKLLQAVLCIVGHPCQVTGESDEATEEAVRSYQARRGLDIDAVIGKDTYAALTADLLRIADELGKKT